MVRELFFSRLSSPSSTSKIRVSGECKTKLYKGLTSDPASVSKTVKYQRRKVLNLASLHMALSIILCELWWHHGILWHHCSDSLLLLGTQYRVFVPTQESFVEKKGQQLVFCPGTNLDLTGMCLFRKWPQVAIQLWWLVLTHIALETLIKMYIYRVQNSTYGP